MCAVIAPIAILLLYIPVSRLKYVSSRNKIDCKKKQNSIILVRNTGISIVVEVKIWLHALDDAEMQTELWLSTEEWISRATFLRTTTCQLHLHSTLGCLRTSVAASWSIGVTRLPIRLFRRTREKQFKSQSMTWH